MPGDEDGDGTTDTAPAVTIVEDANNDGVINKEELYGDIDVAITMPVNTEVDDTLTVTNPDGSTTEYSVTQDMIDSGLELTYAPDQFPEGEQTTVSAVVTDSAGNTSLEGSDSATLDTTPPQAPTVTIIEDINNDGFISSEELDGNVDVAIEVPVDTELGSIITVTDNAGNAQEIEVTQNIIDNGTTVTFPTPAEGDTIVIEATITDPAGNEGPSDSDNAKLDTSDLTADGGVGVTIVSDADNNGLLSEAEIGDANTILVEVSIPVNAIAGDKALVTGTGNADKEIALTQAHIDSGVLKVTFNAPNNGTDFVTTAQVIDPAGNESNIATDSATLDTDAPGAPKVTITEDTNNDGFINASELDGVIDVVVEVLADTELGSILTVTDNAGNEEIITVTQDVIDNGTTLTFPAPAEGEEIRVTAIVADPAGNLSPEGSDSATLDTSDLTPGLSVEITEDINNDGYINASELDGDIDVRVALSNEALAGDTLTIIASANTPQTITLTQDDIDRGCVDASFNAPSDKSEFIVEATIKDIAGNISQPATDSATMQLSAPGKPIVTIAEDTNNDGYINASELDGDIDITVALPGTATAGDTLHLDTDGDGVPDQSVLLSLADINNGNISFMAPNLGDGPIVVEAWVTDKAGNNGDKGSDSAIIDSVVPSVTTTALTIDNVTSDNTIDSQESQGFVQITGSVSGEFSHGDIIELTVNNTIYIATVDQNGEWGVEVAGDDLALDENKQVDAVLYATDNAGNMGIVLANKEYGVLAIEIGDAVAVEGEAVTFEVAVVNPSGMTVPLSLQSGTAALNADFVDTLELTNGVTYSALTGNLDIPAGVTEFAIKVPTIDDSLVESSESFMIEVGEASALGTILDNDIMPVEAVISEEGLNGGIIGGGTTDSATNSGIVDMSNLELDVTTTIYTLTAPTETLVSNGSAVVWSGDGTDTLVATTVNGNEEVLRVAIDNSGEYTIELLRPLEHETTNVEDLLGVNIGINATDGSGQMASGDLNVLIEDDMPQYSATSLQLFVPVSDVSINGLQGGWVNSVTNDGYSPYGENNDADPYLDKIFWSTPIVYGSYSGYEFNDNEQLRLTEDVSIDSLIELGTFSHLNYQMHGDSLRSTTLEVKFNVTIDGEMHQITGHIDLQHNETINTNATITHPDNDDIITITNANQLQTFAVGDRVFEFQIAGFLDATGNLVEEIYTTETARNDFKLYAQILSTDDLPTVEGAVAIDESFGADGVATSSPIVWDNYDMATGTIQGEYGTLYVNENGSYKYIVSRATRDGMNDGEVHEDVFVYTIADRDGDSVESSIVIDIEGIPNDSTTPPIALDLDGNGEFEYTQIVTDINGDGVMDTTAWVGSSDGLLTWDNNGAYEYTFGGNGLTDLEGLALNFDTNGDSIFDANDELFTEFGAWQDTNQDGIVDNGEFTSLAELGIEAINLMSDGNVQSPATGVIEHGQSTATFTNGTTMLIADVSFLYHLSTEVL